MIAVIWVSIVLLTVVLVMQVGLEFFGILILMGVAVAMTFGIMSYGRDGRHKELEEQLSELRDRVEALEAEVEEIRNLNKE